MGSMVTGWLRIGVWAGLTVAALVSQAGAQLDDDWIGRHRPVASRPPWLLRKLGAPEPAAPGERYLQRQSVAPDIDRLTSSDNSRFRVPLFERAEAVIVRDSVERQRDRLVWFGRIENEPGSSVVLVQLGDTLVGNIRSARRPAYELRTSTRGQHVLQSIDPAQNDTRCDVRRTTSPQPRAPAGTAVRVYDPCMADPANAIDVMVLYTEKARDIEGGPEGIEALIYLAMAELNQSLLDSQVDVSYRLVHLGETTGYSETTLFVTHDNLVIDNDGQLDDVMSLRDQHGADLVVLVCDATDASNNGSSWQFGSFDPPFPGYDHPYPAAELALSVVKVGTAASTFIYSLAHELGHLSGADHECDTDGALASPSGHGFKVPALWGTIMATNCARINYWSNPLVEVEGQATGAPEGSACWSDNQLTLETGATTASAYRCDPTGTDDVWLRDSWNDAGDEPNGLPLAEPIYKSPYVWVRNEEDAQFVNVHQHESPVSGGGITNWVYAKLHNGFSSAQTGTVVFMWATPSTIGDPLDTWNVVGTKSVAASEFPAHSTIVVGVPWTSLPAPGDYCLTVHWDSDADDDPDGWSYFAEHVRTSNNLIWRNIAIVPLGSAAWSAKVGVGAPEDLPDPDDPDDEDNWTSVAIQPAWKWPGDSFIKLGRLHVSLDPVLSAAWDKTGRHGSGFKADGDRLLISETSGAVLRGLALPAGARGQLTLTFERKATTPAGEYQLDVEQILGKQDIVGGVGFIIRVPPN